ncbi:tannase/feruloyl esterase family alpha/beta hydrolase [Vibrio mangrovi]|uniref:Tannase and feruloyl esterase n=1 Tax=Vibrio mangrovi TaxID=474394 RepID=A0A1Y6J0B9_9VIBR|nr:tannase/feruloyl esterase family alpha/beta hydrolase [Vibrio mangrovi]MDW6005378.1 tannase/feruloyl esterase family alpha/beta hydrolase [Vibrio mangrovi]SMS02182.1 Tannase and feruloyl esterase [Vibrio mangrovi]
MNLLENKAKISTALAFIGTLAHASIALADNVDRCAQLKDLSIQNGTVTETQYVGKGLSQQDPNRMFTGASSTQFELPAHCLVRGEIDKRTGADGKEYKIRFEVRLPTPEHWQNRFIFQGGGGTDGFLANALGTIPIHGSTALPALARGYAVTSMNGGHDGMDPTFGLDQKARLDYAYAAIGKVTQAAKNIVKAYYDARPQHSYFMGCSNGGREAMIAAQRYPTEFDGVIASNPGFHLSRAAVAETWDTQTLYSIAPADNQGRKVLANALTNNDLKLLTDAVLEKCDVRDGLKDGIVNDYIGCDFDPSDIQCKNGDSSACLSSEKVTAIKAVFGGPKDSQGKPLYNSWPYDTGVSAPGWRMWKLGFSQDATKPDAFNTVLGAGSLLFYFMTPPQPGFNPMMFDFDKDVDQVRETGSLNDATMTMMNSYVSRGGKMLIIQGVSDPVFSADDIRDWYLKTEQNTSHGDNTAMRNWNRLFMIPGMNHCGDGPALDDVDPLTAMEKWVEKNQAPEFLAAKGKAFPDKHQPICVYPKIAKYQGNGDINSIDSYKCE